MRRSTYGVLFLFAFAIAANAAGTLASPPQAQEQQVVDRIAARVENDIILESEVRELSRYQLLLDGQAMPDTQVLDRLIDQWVVKTEADAAHFPQPSDAEIQGGIDRLVKGFASPAEYQEHKTQVGLSDADIHRLITAQLYLSTYLESRFRASVLVDEKAIEDFYNNALVPLAKQRGQTPPTLEVSSDAIQEALIQRGINEQADRWLKESRLRLHVEKFLGDGGAK